HILIRNGGNDNDCDWKGRVRDAITQKILISNGLYIDAQDYQPAHVFFNGQYIGMLNIREPNNKINGVANYGYDDDLMDAFEYSNGYFQKEGTRNAYDRMVSLSANADNDDVYDEMRSLIDMDAYVNFMAATTYIGSTDCILNDNNIKGYRELPDGKFHFTLHDQDFGWGFDDAVQRYDGQYHNQFLTLYNNLKTNQSFCRQFVDSYCVIAGSIYTPERINHIADSICALVAPALAWENRNPVSSYNEQRDNMLSEHSRKARINALRSAYNLGRGMSITLSANIPQASMMVNTQTVPDAKFSGTLFAPVVLTAAGPSNFEFIGWAQGSESNIVTTNHQLKLSEDFDATYIAVFKPILANNSTAPVRINEVSADNDIYVNELVKKDDWIEIYNTTDKPFDVAGCFLTDNVSKPKKYQIMPVAGTNTVIPPNGTLLVWASKRTAQSQLHASFKLDNADGCTLMLTAADESWNDTFEYNTHTSKESYGRYPDGANEIYRFSHPTINHRNQLTTYDFSLDELTFSGAGTSEVSVDFDRKVESVAYYDLAGLPVAATVPGIYIRLTRFTDGTAVSEKVLVSRN
ncbi:MAG: lamin tail domain-containing protein, partial [Muribaculaceae bacterium]|nr:lamin tail domain-containing protein [Muribaculaceae bacterium]